MIKMSKESVRRVQELRRSSAASPQNRNREMTDEEAIEEQLEYGVDYSYNCRFEYCPYPPYRCPHPE